MAVVWQHIHALLTIDRAALELFLRCVWKKTGREVGAQGLGNSTTRCCLRSV